MRSQNQSLVELTKLLSSGDFHDGTSLGASLCMTRSAVWKAIKKLQSYGVQIQSLKGKGYLLQQPLHLLDPALLSAQVGARAEVIVLESVDSTNTYLKNRRATTSPVVCLAEWQSKGRGRLGREWYSPFAKNIYLSCRYAFHKDISELAGLSLAASLSIVKTLNHHAGRSVFAVKWPNDVVLCDPGGSFKKISGSLIDIYAESHGLCHAVIGIGINVNMQDDAGAIDRSWVSLCQVLGKEIDRNAFAVSLTHQLLDDITLFAQDGLASFVEAWSQYDGLSQQTVILQQAGGEVRGIARGVNAQGYLVMEMPDGVHRTFAAGDVTKVL